MMQVGNKTNSNNQKFKQFHCSNIDTQSENEYKPIDVKWKYTKQGKFLC